MRNLLLPVAMFFPLVLSGQTADTSQFIPTSETRDSKVFTRSVITLFNTVSEPGIINPYLKVQLARWTTSQRTQERLYADRNLLTPGQRKSLQLANFFHIPTDLIVQGLPEESMIWKKENEILPLRYEPGRDISLLITAEDSTWTARTDNSGRVSINIDKWSFLSEGGLLQVRIALEENPYAMEEYSVSSVKSSFIRAWAQDRMLLDKTPAGTMADRAAPKRSTYASETRELIETPSLPPEREPAAPSREDKYDIPPPVNNVITTEHKPVIAILDFDGYGVSQMEALILTNRLGTHMVQLGTHKVIERGQMEQVLKEQDFQLSGCTSNECAVEIGRVLGCELMLAGSFGKIGGLYTIDMRIIDVESGGILRTTSYDVRGDVERLLTEGLSEAVRRITLEE